MASVVESEMQLAARLGGLDGNAGTEGNHAGDKFELEVRAHRVQMHLALRYVLWLCVLCARLRRSMSLALAGSDADVLANIAGERVGIAGKLAALQQQERENARSDTTYNEDECCTYPAGFLAHLLLE